MTNLFIFYWYLLCFVERAVEGSLLVSEGTHVSKVVLCPLRVWDIKTIRKNRALTKTMQNNIIGTS